MLSPLLSGHQALDTPSLASFQKYDEGIQSQIEVDDRLWTSNASFVVSLFQNGDVSANIKNMLIYDKPLLSDQPPLSRHLLILRGWPPNGGSTL